MKKVTIISLISAAIIVFAAMAIGIGIYNTPTNRINRYLDLGKKYIEEQNYGLALVEFDRVIDIAPMNVDAYLGKAQAYECTGDIDMLLQTLEEAYEKTDSRRIEDSLIHAYTEQSQNLISETHYEEALNVYDRLLKIDKNNYEIQSGLRELLQEYIKSLEEQQHYGEIQILEERYADKVDAMDFLKESAQEDEIERMQAYEKENAQTDTDAISFEITDGDDWRDIYIKYINYIMNEEGSNGTKCDAWRYKLININDDGIPELYVNTGIMAVNLGTDDVGSALVSVCNGSLIGGGMITCELSYIEGENLFMTSGEFILNEDNDIFYGIHDMQVNYINSIQNDEIVSYGMGFFGKSDINKVQYDVNGNPIYEYYWNYTQVASADEYDSLLNSIYDTRKATIVHKEELCTYEEIIEEINSY